MKKLLILILIALSFCFAFSSNYFTAHLLFDYRASFKTNPEILFAENLINLHIAGRPVNSMRITADADILIYPDSLLSNKRAFHQFRINELYACIFNFPIKQTDSRVGIQRINHDYSETMGTMDNLNAYDQTDRWSFDNRIPDFSASTIYYNGKFTLGLDILPFFSPHNLPASDISVYEMPSFIKISDINETISMPEGSGENINISVFSEYRFTSADIKLHYQYTREKTQWPDTIVITQDNAPWIINIDSRFYYPRINLMGLSIASSLYDAGFNGSIAFIVPERTSFIMDMTDLGRGVVDSGLTDRSFYIKGDLGVDYTFPNGFYMDISYHRGLYYEYGINIHNYIFLSLRMPLFNDRLIIMPLNTGIELSSFNDWKNNAAYSLMPDIRYKPMNNLTMGIKAFLTGGGDNTYFSKNRDYSGIGLYLMADF